MADQEKNRTIFWVAVIGGAGVVGYVLYRRAQDQALAASLATGVPVAAPSAVDVLSTTLTSLISGGLSKLAGGSPPASMPAGSAALATCAKVPLPSGMALPCKIRQRGDAHYTAWSTAFRKNVSTYAFGGKCFDTTTGNELAKSACPTVPGSLSDVDASRSVG
jgi:hypothetical protein